MSFFYFACFLFFVVVFFSRFFFFFFFFQAEDGIRDTSVTGVQTCALPISPEEVRVFFEALARLAPVLSTVRGLARHLRICPSTLMSRFYRVGLPSPKTYLAGMRLLHAAYRSEERRVGKECRSRGGRGHLRK